MSIELDLILSLLDIPGVGRAYAEKLLRGGYKSAEDVADADPQELAQNCNIPKKKAKTIVSAANGLINEEIDSEEEEKAWRALIDETTRQHNLSVGTLTSMLQRLGIILAFVPILLLEAVKAIPSEPIYFDYLPAVSLGICFMVGILIIVRWKVSTPSFKTDIDYMVDLYDKNEWRNLHSYVLDSAMTEYDRTMGSLAVLRRWVFLMTVTLLFGMASLACVILDAKDNALEMLISLTSFYVLVYVLWSAALNEQFEYEESGAGGEEDVRR